MPYLDDQPLDGLFTTRESGKHKTLKSPLAGVYSMTNIRNYERHVDECTEVFVKVMRQYEGQKVNLGEYFHWFAFDAIGTITFQRRFGFIDQTQKGFDAFRPDDAFGSYFAVIGQIPWLDRFLFGNRLLVNAIMRRYPDLPDPLGTVMSVIHTKFSFLKTLELINVRLLIERSRDTTKKTRTLIGQISWPS